MGDRYLRVQTARAWRRKVGHAQLKGSVKAEENFRDKWIRKFDRMRRERQNRYRLMLGALWNSCFLFQHFKRIVLWQMLFCAVTGSSEWKCRSALGWQVFSSRRQKLSFDKPLFFASGHLPWSGHILSRVKVKVWDWVVRTRKGPYLKSEISKNGKPRCLTQLFLHKFTHWKLFQTSFSTHDTSEIRFRIGRKRQQLKKESKHRIWAT